MGQHSTPQPRYPGDRWVRLPKSSPSPIYVTLDDGALDFLARSAPDGCLFSPQFIQRWRSLYPFNQGEGLVFVVWVGEKPQLQYQITINGTITQKIAIAALDHGPPLQELQRGTWQIMGQLLRSLPLDFSPMVGPLAWALTLITWLGLLVALGFFLGGSPGLWVLGAIALGPLRWVWGYGAIWFVVWGQRWFRRQYYGGRLGNGDRHRQRILGLWERWKLLR